MNYRTIIDKLDTDEWAIPEKFLSEHEEFLQALVDKVEEQCNIDLVMLSREQIAKQMGWDDYAEMMLNEDNIESITKGAINMIFIAYKLKKPFD